MNPGENAPALFDSRTHAHARPTLPVGSRALIVLELIGLPAVIELIVAGHAQITIAATLGVSQASLAAWLCNQRGPGAAIYSEALRASAEAMLDQAHAVLEAAEPTTPGVMKARAVADLLIRKAGIRNRAYRDRIDSTTLLVDGAGDTLPAQVPTFRIVIASQPDPGRRTFDMEGD
ncbi:MAG: hypothetical protein WBX11_12805 [Thiobacillaceae bacterium]